MDRTFHRKTNSNGSLISSDKHASHYSACSVSRDNHRMFQNYLNKKSDNASAFDEYLEKAWPTNGH